MPPSLADIADQLEARARQLQAEGKHEAATELALAAVDVRKAVSGIQSLPPGTSSDNLQQMTGAQLVRRGKAIAQAKSAKSKDRLWQAITASKWGSQEVYAKKRLGVSPGSLSAYRSGNTPCPRPVAAKVRADFEIGDDYWPAGVVD